MTAALVPRIEQFAAVRHHSIIISKAWGHTKSALLPRNRRDLERLEANRTYRRHVEFFMSLPHMNPVDITLIDAAVRHVDRTLERQRSWDGGHLARTTWPERRDLVVADLIGAQDILTWARQNLYAGGKLRPTQRRGPNFMATLQQAADSYLEQMLQHVIDVRDG
jgi:hypothetical protein